MRRSSEREIHGQLDSAEGVIYISIDTVVACIGHSELNKS